jgi:asparagine synthase (glutamine-hydrolysing)
MCGITGIFQPGGVPSEGTAGILASMTRAIAHRGPDDAGVWIDPEAGIGLGHRRLAVIDLSPLGHQPMRSAEGRFMVTFNGEIYNHRELRTELSRAGQRFRGHSDTEVLLAAVSAWGIRTALERFNGMFALGLWDAQDRVLYLARDRMGEKPLYYGRIGGSFVFASELKAFRHHPEFSPRIDRDSLALFLRYSCVPAPHCIYQGFRKLPPGTLLALRGDDIAGGGSLTEYWSARAVAEAATRDPFPGSAAEAADRLDGLLRDAVRMRMEADVPLGAFLSGGIDSSTVVALMQAQSERPVRTFTIGFHEGAYDEAAHARAIARHLGTDHTELYVTPGDALEVIPRLPTLFDEPFSDSSQIPTFLVSRLARQHVTVSLSGDGGDELFGGYPRQRWGRVWQNGRALPRGVRRAAAALLERAPLGAGFGRALTHAASLEEKRPGARLRRLAGVLRAESPEEAYQGLISHWKQGTADVVIEAREPATRINDPAARADLADPVDRLIFLDQTTYLPDDILQKVDRATMAVALEARVPLLDPRVIEFAWRLPLPMRIRGGRGKWLLREVLRRYVPDVLVERPKMGFCTPIDSWLRGPLRDWAEELLAESRLLGDGYFYPGTIREKWRQHRTGERDWNHDLWDVLMFQAWLDEVRTPIRQPVTSGVGAVAIQPPIGA